MAIYKYSEASHDEVTSEDEDVLVHLLNSAGIRLTRRYASCDWIVAETDAEEMTAVVGALAWYYTPDRGDGLSEVGFSLAVDPGHRRQGIAKQLITKLVQRAKQLHVDVVTADVLSQHLPAMLVEFGFQPKEDDSLGMYELDLSGSALSASTTTTTHVCVVAHDGKGRRFLLQAALDDMVHAPVRESRELQLAAATLAQTELRSPVQPSELRRQQTVRSEDAVVAVFVAAEPVTPAVSAPNTGQPLTQVPDNEFDRGVLMIAQSYVDRAYAIMAASEYQNLAMICWRVPEQITDQLPKLRKYPDLPHCTLACFDLPTDENERNDLLDRARKSMDQLCSSFPVLSENCKTTGFARFAGSEEDPVVVTISCPGINDMRAELTRLLAENNVEIKSNFEFVPHITIGYLRKDDELEIDADRLAELSNLPLEVEHLALVAGDELIASSPLEGGEDKVQADFGRKGRRRTGQETSGPAVLETWEMSSGNYQFCLWEGKLPKTDAQAAREGKWLVDPPFEDLERRMAAGEDVNLLACSSAALLFLAEDEAVSDLVDFDDDVFVYVPARELFIDLQLKSA